MIFNAFHSDGIVGLGKYLSIFSVLDYGLPRKSTQQPPEARIMHRTAVLSNTARWIKINHVLR